jgi:hypothetical protein
MRGVSSHHKSCFIAAAVVLMTSQNEDDNTSNPKVSLRLRLLIQSEK